MSKQQSSPRALTIYFGLTFIGAALLALYSMPQSAQAQTPITPAAQSEMANYLAEVRKKQPEFSGFDPEKGKALYFLERKHSKKMEMRSCTTCHTSDPAKAGQTDAGKSIKAISPAVNSERFTEVKEIKKWFRRNCPWVLERPCTAEEKGHFLTYLFSL